MSDSLNLTKAKMGKMLCSVHTSGLRSEYFLSLTAQSVNKYLVTLMLQNSFFLMLRDLVHAAKNVRQAEGNGVPYVPKKL